MTVPPAQQCTLPSCENEAVDPVRRVALCESHLAEVEGGESVTESEQSAESDPVCDTTPEADTSNCEDVDHVPAPLDELGEVFVPIPPGEKGTHRPRTPENLYAPGDDVLQSYLEAGHNYGVACRGDLAVVDADEPERLRELLDALPETAWQVSGSRSSEHHFLRVPGLDADLPLVDPETDEELGHVKAAEQSYVVGPGSRHPSGNHYGPLEGEALATLSEEDLRGLIDQFRPDDADSEPCERAVRAASRTGGDSADLAVHDVLSRTSCPAGARVAHPFHGSDTGANFMVDESGETFRCWRHGCTGNALHLVGIDEGVISCGDWKHGGLDTNTWSEIFEAAREAGYDLPDQDQSEPSDHVATLPDAPALPEGTSGWDWQAAARRAADEDPVQQARDRTTAAIVDVVESRGREKVLLEALPTLGKSYGTVKAAAETREPVTVLTTRGRKEQYEQVREWCREHGLDVYTLPAFTHDCTTANGDHGDDWKRTARDWYNRGATPQEIHKHAESELGRPLPCQEGDHDCPYSLQWDFEPDEYDVLLGHFAHAHKEKATTGRTVVVDESPEGAYERCLDVGLEGAVTYFLQSTDALPFEDYAELIEERHDEQRRADALAWFQARDLQPEGLQVFGSDAGHAAAPLAVFTILAGAKNNLGNGWERAPFDDGDRVGLFNREQGRVWLLTPPDLDRVANVLGLDGTPTRELWELALGERLTPRQVLSTEERQRYLTEGLGLRFVRGTDAVKPYNNPDHVAVEQDAALLEEIADEYGQQPDLISTSAALDQYEQADVLEHVDATGYYGNILGSNEFADSRLGVVIGSNHYGDGYVKKWAAYAGATAERGEGKGSELSYGSFGDKVLAHMRDHDTLQAALRFGRDGNGAVVYVHTDTLPDWVPIASEARVVTAWSDGMRQVLEAIRGQGSWRTADVVDAVDIGRRQVFDHLETLADRGVVDREHEGRGYTWRDDGLHHVGEHGDVELEPIDLDELAEDEVAELARSSTYTWEFRNSGETGDDSGGAGASGPAHRPEPASAGADPPPDGAD